MKFILKFMRTIFILFVFYFLLAFQGKVHSQTDFQYGLSHRFIVNNFEKSKPNTTKPLSDSSSFSDLPRGMEISLTKHVFNSFHLNGSFRAGFANYQNDSTNSSFWGSDVQLVYSPMFKAVNPYVGLGSGIIRGNNLVDFGFPVNLGINVKVDKAFYIDGKSEVNQIISPNDSTAQTHVRIDRFEHRRIDQLNI